LEHKEVEGSINVKLSLGHWACVISKCEGEKDIYAALLINASETSNLEHKEVEGSINVKLSLGQCFSAFVRPRLGKFLFHKT